MTCPSLLQRILISLSFLNFRVQYNNSCIWTGQTESGKTQLMGRAYTGDGVMGVTPRAINDIFLKSKKWRIRTSELWYHLWR